MNRFRALLPGAGRLEESRRVQLFTGGLLPPLSHVVQIHNPATLAVAESGPSGGIDGAQQAAAGVGQARDSRTAASTGTAPSTTGATSPQIRGGANQAKRLSPEEQAERRCLGLCYNCNEPYGRGHNRVCRRIFYIDGVELGAAAQTEDEADHNVSVFSLRAVAGMPIFDTMQVRVTVGAATFTALLDTGSTHNFIAEAAASRTGLHAHSDPRLNATVANASGSPGQTCSARHPLPSPARSSVSTSTSCHSPATIWSSVPSGW
jgi:hypothetical protein